MDTLLERTGSFGRFQKMMCILLTSSAVLSGLTAFISVFNNAVPEIRCVDKAQSFQTNETFLQDSCKLWANISKSESLNQESQYECHYDTSKLIIEYRVYAKKLHTLNVNKIWILKDRRTIDILLDKTKNRFFSTKSFGGDRIIYSSLSYLFLRLELWTVSKKQMWINFQKKKNSIPLFNEVIIFWEKKYLEVLRLKKFFQFWIIYA